MNSMVIHERHTVSGIREEFSRLFPYLRLEFLVEDTPGRRARGYAWYKRDVSLQELLQPGSGLPAVTVTPEMRVADLEAYFAQAGLNVQVYRKSGKSWIETRLTDHWTLEGQNAEGEALSRHLHLGLHAQSFIRRYIAE